MLIQRKGHIDHCPAVLTFGKAQPLKAYRLYTFSCQICKLPINCISAAAVTFFADVSELLQFFENTFQRLVISVECHHVPTQNEMIELLACINNSKTFLFYLRIPLFRCGQST